MRLPQIKKGMGKWIALGAITFAYLISLFYDDLYSTYRHAYLLLDCTFDGEFFDFYDRSFSMASETHGYGANYLFPIYLIIALWILPCWCLSQAGVVDYLAPGCLIWAKCLVLLACVGCVFMLSKLLEASQASHRSFWSFAFATSLPFFIYSLSGLYDSIELFFGLWGLWLLAKEDEPSIKSLLILSVAISIKFLMVFPIAIWLLLKEKRLLRLLRALLLLTSVSIASKLLFLPFSSGTTIELQTSMVDRLLSLTVPGSLYPISIFCLIFFLACACAFCRPIAQDSKEFLYTGSWLSSCIYIGFILFVERCHPFWAMLAFPFIVLMLASNGKALKLSMIFECVMEIILIIIQANYFNWVLLNGSVFKRLPFQDVPQLHLATDNGIDLAKLFDYLHIAPLIPAIMALLCACCVILLYISYKPCIGKGDSTFAAFHIDEKDYPALCRKIETYRLAILLLFYLLNVLIVFIL